MNKLISKYVIAIRENWRLREDEVSSFGWENIRLEDQCIA